MSRILVSALMLATAFWVVTPHAAGQDTDREAQLLELVERLERRVSDLEQQVEAMQAATPAPDAPQAAVPAPELAARVEALESHAAATDAPEDFRVYWKDGFRFATHDERFTLKLGGLFQADSGWLDADHDLELAHGPLEDRAAIQRARLTLSGTMYRDLYFKLGYDFAGGDADFVDNLLGIGNLPGLGHVEVGYFKEPFGLEQLASTRDGIFMELSQPVALFTPNRNTGLQAHNTAFNQRFTWAAGAFRQSDSYGRGGTDGDYALTARLTGLPWYAQEGRRLLHLGAGLSHRNVDGTLQFRTGPQSKLADVSYADTGRFAADHVNLYNAELALQAHRFWLMAEYYHADAATPGDDKDFSGFYLASGLFLTPDYRRYNRDRGVFAGVRPRRNVALGGGEARGWGAWEAAVRYSELDLDDGLITRGGDHRNWSAILNWYLNPNTRASLSYLHTTVARDLFEGDADALQLRFQFAL